MDILLALHAARCIKVDAAAMIAKIEWQKPASPPSVSVEDASHPGMYLATALGLGAAASVDMAEIVQQWMVATPKADVIEVLRFLNKRGFVKVDTSELLDCDFVSWARPGVTKKLAEWQAVWAGSAGYDVPKPGPAYVNVRDFRGRRASIAFLGDYSDQGTLATAAEIVGQVWKISPAPTMCIMTDAGSMHPRQCDSIERMHHMPAFHEWVLKQQAKQDADGAKGGGALGELVETVDSAEGTGTGAQAPQSAVEGASSQETGTPGKLPPLMGKLREGIEKVKRAKRLSLREVCTMALEAWDDELPTLDADVLGDSSINNLIFTKLKEVFAALLDAAALSGAAIVTDRTAGQGSATADLLLELAIERLSSKPTIIAIDSLERLGKAKSSSRAHSMIEKLAAMYHNAEATSQAPNGTEREVEMDWEYELSEFDKAARFAQYPDSRLPFDVLPEHQRKLFNNTCDPNRKWRYFYMDGLFASATHYIIKTNDLDELSVESIAPCGYLYAHGDTRTYKRLRDNIQKGAPIVMLHNSGGVVTAFSWLQRVMAYQRPPPDYEQLRGPLKFLVSCLSKANWVHDFGAPEVLMMSSLASRAPHLFRKSIISVDVLTESEEQVLDTITSCFATSGGVPALGLGNAEVNVIFSAWKAHMMLCANAKTFWRYSIVAQTFVWFFAIVTTATVTTQSSLGTGYDENGAVLQRTLELGSGETLDLTEDLNHVALILPIAAALLTTMMSKFLWRDKWSVCVMAATQLAAEIYKFRISVMQYDMKPKPLAEGEPPPKPLPAKEKARLARALFVERVTTLYSACLTELSQNGALKKKHQKVSNEKRFQLKANSDNKPTMAEWFAIKMHAEKFFYKSKFVLPSEVSGISFLNWMSGLRPYLQQKTMKEMLQDSIETLVKENTIVLRGGPLTDSESKLVRHALAKSIGLPKTALDKQKDELRQLQRSIVSELHKMAEREAKSSLSATAKVHPVDDDDAYVDEPIDAMRRRLVEEQGLRYGTLTAEQKEEEKKKKTKTKENAKAVDDDYLCGPMSVETYVMFRMRPLKDRLELQVEKLSGRLCVLDVLAFFLNATGAVFASYSFSEWIAVTVMIVSVINSLIEFTQLRNQVVSCNLALCDLEKALVWWDSLSLVRRRTAFVKEQLVDVTERSLLMVVDAHTTAASNTQVSVEKSMDDETDTSES